MAKNKKDLFKSNLSVRPVQTSVRPAVPSQKPKDSQIEKVATQIEEEEVKKEKGFHLKMGIEDFDKLAQVSKKTHIPKKYIILEALKGYYERNGHT